MPSTLCVFLPGDYRAGQQSLRQACGSGAHAGAVRGRRFGEGVDRASCRLLVGVRQAQCRAQSDISQRVGEGHRPQGRREQSRTLSRRIRLCDRRCSRFLAAARQAHYCRSRLSSGSRRAMDNVPSARRQPRHGLTFANGTQESCSPAEPGGTTGSERQEMTADGESL
jgi:hypothetical protein